MNMTYEQWLCALALWREARGSSITCLNAIWWVLQNRVNDHRNRWPKDLANVILQPMQFSSFNANDPNSTKLPRPPRHPTSPSGSASGTVSDWDAFGNCQAVVTNPLGTDPTGGATNYHSIPDGDPLPAWADGIEPCYTCGPFKFFKL